MRRVWSFRLIPGTLSSTATGKASDKGAHNTVNGYMAFILFSVAGLARESFSASASASEAARSGCANAASNPIRMPQATR